MHHTRTFVLLLAALTLPISCAEIVSPAGDGASGSGGGAGDGSMMEDPADSAGGSVVIVGSSTGGEGMGGAPTTSGGTTSTGGSSGPRPLPSCSDHSECNDNNPCTSDTCDTNGQCDFADNGTCECTTFNAATACDDENPCTNDTCVANECEHSNNTGSCDDDGDACTLNVCENGSCTHPGSGLCTSTTVTLRSVRDGNAGQWVTVNETTSWLLWNVATAEGQAAVFDQVDVSPSTFKLHHVASGLYVVLGADDEFLATGTEEEAAIFGTTACPLDGSPGVGLNVTTDDDGGSFAAAEPGGEIKARSGGCDSGSTSAWERFEITPTGG